MMPGDADCKPSSHGVPDQMGAVAAEIVDHGDDVGGALLLTIEFGIGRLVAQTMAQRVDACDTEPVGQGADDPTLRPAGRIHQQSVLQDDKRAGAIDRVVDPLPTIDGEWHCSPRLKSLRPRSPW